MELPDDPMMLFSMVNMKLRRQGAVGEKTEGGRI